MTATTYNHTDIMMMTGDAMLTRLLLSALLLLPAAATAGEVETPVWNYMGGGNDDENWSTLSHDFILCDTGQNQSPVGIGETRLSTMLPMTLHYHKAAMTMEKKDRTLVIDMQGAGTLVDEEHHYRLEEMRIHTPAEHEVIGKLYPAELQLVHRDAKGKILILAVFLDNMDKGNSALQKILDKAPAKPGVRAAVTFNPADLLPRQRGYYAYSGSLSWPPCTEGVEWRVMKEPVAMSQAQMKAIGTLLGRNARLLQPLYFRTIRQSMY